MWKVKDDFASRRRNLSAVDRVRGATRLMYRNDLQNAAARAGIDRAAYHLPGEDHRLRILGDCYVLEIVEGGWAVYYWERGTRHDEVHLETEDEACGELLLRLTSDPTTRRRPN
jgi:hypothetical protein